MFSPIKEFSTYVITGVFLVSLVLTGCSDHSIMGPETGTNAPGTSVTTTTVDNRDAPHNDSTVDIHADKNGENATTYGGDHNL
jgi:hypothetical protein